MKDFANDICRTNTTLAEIPFYLVFPENPSPKSTPPQKEIATDHYTKGKKLQRALTPL